MTTVAPQFLPWMRVGLTTAIDSVAAAGLAPTDVASTTVAVELKSTSDSGELVTAIAGPSVRLLGPADVVGIDTAQVLRQDPEPGATDAEPNYFACIELAAPDLPWRYTPATPDAASRLQPWLVLVVVEERDGVWLQDRGVLLRPVLHVDSAQAELPDLAQCWAWAHVQAEHDLASGAVTAYAESPELFRARLMCPRRLPPQTAWIACLVPAFEAGRRAGLGEPGGENLGPAWTQISVDVSLPVYHHWRFNTGERGDFESLVRRLRARELPATVGRRDFDIGEPGGGLPSAPGTLVTYSGALVSPFDGDREWLDPHRTATKNALRTRLNRALDPPAELTGLLWATPPGADTGYNALRDDPVVGPPAYAASQAKRRRVPREDAPPIWFEQLNTEPHRRAAAGLGAQVVRQDQEAMLAAAWEYASEQVDVNRMLGRARLGWELARKAQPRFTSLPDANLMQVAGPALARLSNPDGGTMLGAVADSAFPAGLVSGAFRRLTRNTKALARTDSVMSAALADPVAFSATWTAPRAPIGADLQGAVAATSGKADYYTNGSIGFAGLASPGPSPAGILESNPDLVPAARVTSAPDPALAARASAARARAADRATARKGRQTMSSAEFVARARALEATIRSRSVGATGPSAARVRQDGPVADVAAVEAVAAATVIAAERPTGLGRATVGIPWGGPTATLADTVRAAIDPMGTITRMVETRALGLPADRDHDVPDRIWVRPQFTTPMYERLRSLSVEYLVPGMSAVPDNTLGLLRTNREFMEAFLAGLNHELFREFVWREYPARSSATWCQQFFDSGPEGPVDIKVIGNWDPDAGLGANPPESSTPADLVLLIKGALPRRYPDLRVYAVEADWIDHKRREKVGGDVRFPVFSGRLQTDAYFYGFALTEQAARGSTVEPSHPGWFFVLEERPRAPRFGLDAPRERFRGVAPGLWSDLSWAHLVPAEVELPSFVDISGPAWVVGAGAMEGNGGLDSWGEDAAAMARITLQRPVRMLSHADSMLPPPTAVLGGIGDLLDPGFDEDTLILHGGRP